MTHRHVVGGCPHADWHDRQTGSGKLAVALVSRTIAELKQQLDYAIQQLQRSPETTLPRRDETDAAIRDRVFYSPKPLGPTAKIAMVYPGSGNHFAGMGRELSAQFPDVLRRQQRENRRLRGQYAPDQFWADDFDSSTSAKQCLFGQVALGTLTADLLSQVRHSPRRGNRAKPWRIGEPLRATGLARP